MSGYPRPGVSKRSSRSGKPLTRLSRVPSGRQWAKPKFVWCAELIKARHGVSVEDLMLVKRTLEKEISDIQTKTVDLYDIVKVGTVHQRRLIYKLTGRCRSASWR